MENILEFFIEYRNIMLIILLILAIIFICIKKIYLLGVISGSLIGLFIFEICMQPEILKNEILNEILKEQPELKKEELSKINVHGLKEILKKIDDKKVKNILKKMN